jgi:hypothetical protein
MSGKGGTPRPGFGSPDWVVSTTHDAAGYVYILMPGHLRADGDGYVKLGLLAWEQLHGIPFPKGKYPHHKDLDKGNDDPENIEPLTKSEHSKLHSRLKREAKESKDETSD